MAWTDHAAPGWVSSVARSRMCRVRPRVLAVGAVDPAIRRGRNLRNALPLRRRGLTASCCHKPTLYTVEMSACRRRSRRQQNGVVSPSTRASADRGSGQSTGHRFFVRMRRQEPRHDGPSAEWRARETTEGPCSCTVARRRLISLHQGPMSLRQMRTSRTLLLLRRRRR